MYARSRDLPGEGGDGVRVVARSGLEVDGQQDLKATQSPCERQRLLGQRAGRVRGTPAAAMPKLVVAIAGCPSAASACAVATSQAFGSTSGRAAWCRRRNASTRSFGMPSR